MDDFSWCRGCGIDPFELRLAYERIKSEYEKRHAEWQKQWIEREQQYFGKTVP
jgi:hypothetical protein